MTAAVHKTNAARTPRNGKSAGRLFPVAGSVLAAALAFAVAAPARGQGVDAAVHKLKRAGFEQNLGTQIPLDLAFVDDGGRPVTLAKYFDGSRPVLLTLNYYRCPMLCTLVLNGVVDCVKKLPFEIGKDFDIVTVSFDPRDTTQLAAEKKASYVASLGRPGAEKGWHFLTGRKEQIDALCAATGFSYSYDAASDQFGHASGIMLATPGGKLSHYFYGMEYIAKDVRLGLVDASQGKIGSPVEKLILWCFHYDPTAGKYSASVMGIIRLGCVLVISAVGVFLLVQLRREFRHPRKAAA